jgi:hypothetical protein
VVPPSHEGLVLFRRYNWRLDTLKLNVLIAFPLFITIGEVCMFKCETSLLVVNNDALPSSLIDSNVSLK